jgi:tagaturonate epimerase
MKKLARYSMGIGDRFGHQGNAQINAITEASKKGVEITPVWNKSEREHQIIGTHPSDVRKEADSATKYAGFRKPYFVDADHINLDTVDRFIPASDFFTIDVTSYIGKRADDGEIEKFISGSEGYFKGVCVPGIKKRLKCAEHEVRDIAEKYLFAALKAGMIYRKIAERKDAGSFITEVSMDEVQHPQTPVELFFILKMLSDEKVPIQTIAPKFIGRFNKGVDYEGDPAKFAVNFEEDLMVVSHAADVFGLPDGLKISVHSGSDKFAIYPVIRSALEKHEKGIHIKTAGTTWLEEVIGLAEAGGKGLDFVKDLYIKSLSRLAELSAPYGGLTDIRMSALPSADEICGWNARKFASSISHDEGNQDYNPSMRQLIHIAYKLAAQKIDEYSALLKDHEDIISQRVFENIYTKHICRLFLKV